MSKPGSIAKGKMVKTVGLSEFYEAIANLPEQVIKDAIEIASEVDPKAKLVLERMEYPENEGRQPMQILMESNVSFAKVAKWVQEMANTVNRMKNSLAMGKILDDMHADAKRKPKVCRGCKGAGKLRTIRKAQGDLAAVAEERICPECEGSGFTMAAGHSKTRQMLMETDGLISSGGTSVKIDNRSMTLTSAPSVAETVRRANQALATRVEPKTLPAEIVE